MRAYVAAACVGWLVCSWGAAAAEAARANPDDLDSLYSALYAPNAKELPRQLQVEDGFLRFIGAPPGTYFVSGVSGSSAAPETAAQAFVANHKGAFSVPSDRLAYITERVNSEDDRAYVRLEQTYNGLPVFGARMTVQTTRFGGITCVLSRILRDTTLLDTGAVPLTPAVGLDAARQKAVTAMALQYDRPGSSLMAQNAERMIFDPQVVGRTGPVTVAWKMTVDASDVPPVSEVVLVDGFSGEVVYHYPLIHEGLNRTVWDLNNKLEYEFVLIDGVYYIVLRATLMRVEGSPPSGLVDADNAYDFLGDTYKFYHDVNGRDSLDDNGEPLVAWVRYCDSYSCPTQNAFFNGGDDSMYFGDGWVLRDVTAHELTHGVTKYTSDLIYQDQSGAINESFSDMWGEWVDIVYGKPSASVRWLVGQDIPFIGAIRSMKDPTLFKNPDRMGSPFYYNGVYDAGGVHTNSGVGNKLCYLLTDGDAFNGRTVHGLGYVKASQLFYECQTNLLTPASDYGDLYYALGQATNNLRYAFDEQQNVLAAALAVEIEPDRASELIGTFRAVPTVDATGKPVIALAWKNPTSVNFRRVILVRDTTAFPRLPTEGIEVYRGVDEQTVDAAVKPGTEYFYTLFSQMTAGFPDSRSSRATASMVPADFLTETFTSAPPIPNEPGFTATPFDLSYTQLLFSPVGAPSGDLGEGLVAPDYYSRYSVTVKKNIIDLPVQREDAEGSSFQLPLTQNGVFRPPVALPAPIPFFGVRHTRLYIAANGYVAFEEVKPGSPENTVVSLATHFAVPRISFLFSDLAPNIGGSMWARILKDRLVLTFENVPEMEQQAVPPSTNPNTVQVEMFFSGHIRITYLGINAKTALVGLSDGAGTPFDPGDLFPGLRHVTLQSNFSAMPQNVTALSINQIAAQQVDAGKELVFVAGTSYPPGLGTPTLSAEWNFSPLIGQPMAAPFADNHDGTGTFRWQTNLQDFGVFLVRVTATLGAMTAYQDVTVAVGITEPLPEALSLLLKTNDPVEDPRRDRPVDDDLQLIADYSYSHPAEFLKPDWYSEGPTQIVWFKNNSMAPAFNDQKVIPPMATKPNERWFYMVTPRTISGKDGLPIEGMTRMSPVVTILALPRILNVALPGDLPANVTPGEPIDHLPSAAGPITGGTKVIILGKRLGHPMSVTFGGIEAQSIRAIDDFRLEVVTPAHAPSFVIGGAPIPEDVVVVTPAGPTRLPQAFTYVDTGAPIAKADINRDGKVDALDVQIVINTVLEITKANNVDADVNRDGEINSADIQAAVNAAVGK